MGPIIGAPVRLPWRNMSGKRGRRRTEEVEEVEEADDVLILNVVVTRGINKVPHKITDVYGSYEIAVPDVVAAAKPVMSYSQKLEELLRDPAHMGAVELSSDFTGALLLFRYAYTEFQRVEKRAKNKISPPITSPARVNFMECYHNFLRMILALSLETTKVFKLFGSAESQTCPGLLGDIGWRP